MNSHFPAISVSSAIALLLASAAPAAADELADLKRQVQEMQKRVDDMERKQQQAPPAASDVVTKGSFPGSFKLPGTDTSVKIGGYAKLDLIYDADAIGSEDVFATNAIVTDNTANRRDGHTRLHAKESRVNITMRTPSAWGDFLTFVEGDFFGAGGNQLQSNSTTLRIRHAYGELGNLLAGQTWTNFMDVAALPETLDFEGPNGELFVRQAQVRWTQPFGGGRVSFAVENPEGDFTDPVGGAASAFDQLPDATVALRADQSWGHVQLGGLVREIRFDGGPGRGQEGTFGWGLSVSGRFNTFGKDNLKFQANYGDGIGRYIVDLAGTGSDAIVINNSLETLEAFGGYISYQQWWNDRLRSSLVLGYVDVETVPQQAATAFDNSTYGALNLIWSPIPPVNLGIEYLYGTREDRNGRDGDASRVQASAKYSF